MSYPIPTLEELHELLLAARRNAFPGAVTTPLHPNWKRDRMLAGAVTDNHAHLAAIQRDLLPDRSGEDMLERWGSIKGVPRGGATPARKAAALRVFGDVAAEVEVGDLLDHSSGLRYQVNSAAAIPGAGFIEVDIVAVDVGEQTRLPAGDTLRFVTPPTGIEEVAELVLDLDEDGHDVEPLGSYRNRVLLRFSRPPLGGAPNDFVFWALEWGAAAAFSYPTRNGKGSVDLVALHAGSGTARILTEAERVSLRAYVAARMPANDDLRILEAEDEEVDVEVLVRPIDPLAFDWHDETPLEVASWDAGSRTLTFTAARPLSMQAGHRLIVKPAAGGTGEQHVIDALSSTDAVILQKVPEGYTPAATDLVYSGGGLVDQVRDALLEHVNELGTANPDDREYGEWEGTLRVATIFRIAQLTAGVLDSQVAAPAANVAPADPPWPSAAIGLLTPGRVLVRRLW